MVQSRSEEQPGEGNVPGEDTDIVKRALADEMAKSAANLAGWQRAQADFANYKRRSEQEKEDLGRFANASFAFNFLPVLDDLERALAAAPVDVACVAWVHGIRHIERKLRNTLELEGLQTIESVGKPFDPRFHEAVKETEGEDGIVIEEFQKGYRFRDRVIRPAKVAVGTGQKKVIGGDE